VSRRLKVGIVGAGIGGHHLAAFRNLPDLYVVEAVCDVDGDRATALAAQNGIARTVTAYDDLLALDLDIVDICTPSNLHFAQASRALEAGRHAIVEKPLAGSLAEVDDLKETEARTGRRVAPIFQYRYGNGFRRLMHLKAKGIVGKPYAATIDTHWLRTPAYYDNPWRGRWSSELGGTLVTHAIHAHDLMCEVMGPIRSVYARIATRVNRIETEDCAAVALEMESGALVTLSVTLGSQKEISRLRFCFDGLTVESGSDPPYEPGAEPWQFITTDEDLMRRIGVALADFIPLPERWTGQFLALHGALTRGAAMPVLLDDARRSIELLTAAYASGRTGEAVRLPIGRDHPFYRGWRPVAGEGLGAA
jgi:predicted dehydrogenase